MKIISSLLDVIASYHAVISDAYGVFWDGKQLYPGVLETFQALVDAGKGVVIVSNSTRHSQDEQDRYWEHGLKQKIHYHALVTSGDVTKQWLQQGRIFPEHSLRRVWICGYRQGEANSYEHIFAGTSIMIVPTVEEADFLYMGQVDDEMSMRAHELRAQMHSLVLYKKPMLCANPDRIAPMGEQFFLRQGAAAAYYEEAGGEVFYVGKPYHPIYDVTFNTLQALGFEGPYLAVGDTVETDIEGASNHNIDSVLVYKTGLASRELKKYGSIVQFAEQLPLMQRPSYWLGSIGYKH